ncbi:MAG: LysM peptidoglycan-binding domain-containing protein [Firmicutes bacterium]|nr:LysM peptidoglycan-binding domain-containing protein [Bacillota bacterium]
MNLKNRIIAGVVTLTVLCAGVMPYAMPAMAWTYRIESGDSLYKLSKEFGPKVNTLQKANGLKSDLIISGKTLWIPDTNTEVKPMQNSRGQNDLYLLARLISGEARGESYQGQVAVGAVIMNRINSKGFPNTIAGNVYKKGEFESISNGQIWGSVTPSALKAAKAAISGEDPTGGALYFYNPAKVHSKDNWIWSRQVTGRIGLHVFAI